MKTPSTTSDSPPATATVPEQHHLRFHLPHAHLSRAFGNDWFALKAEAFARFFGTPVFLVAQTTVVIVWICLNVFGFTTFDIYPFILLNLAFSLQAAYAAPLILLAQTRQADRDKAHADADAHHREDLALGYPLKLVTTKGHLFVRWEDAHERFNIEAAGQGVNRFSDDYYRHWPLEVSPDEILAEGHLKSLSPAGELAVFLSIRGMCLKEARRYGEAADSFREAARLAPACRSYALMQSQMEGMAGHARNTAIALTAKGEPHP